MTADDLPVRGPDQVRRACARKLWAVQVTDQRAATVAAPGGATRCQDRRRCGCCRDAGAGGARPVSAVGAAGGAL